MTGEFTVWDAVRDAARTVLRDEATAWCRAENYPLDQWDIGEAAFIAGGEWMIEAFAKAMQLRSGVVD